MSGRTFPEPTAPAADQREVLLRYLDYFRGVVDDRVRGMGEGEARASRLPSGWSPLELANHLLNVERRWLEWGFEGQDVDDPWADTRDDRWFVAEGVTTADVLEALRSRGERTREIVLRHSLDEVGAASARWDGAPPPTLDRVLLHLLQEYARHAGHLDIVRELHDGVTGE